MSSIMAVLFMILKMIRNFPILSLYVPSVRPSMGLTSPFGIFSQASFMRSLEGLSNPLIYFAARLEYSGGFIETFLSKHVFGKNHSHILPHNKKTHNNNLQTPRTPIHLTYRNTSPTPTAPPTTAPTLVGENCVLPHLSAHCQ